jgi:Lrp/AsnC family transcriptional regulator, leucine-responsive regulatory protein
LNWPPVDGNQELAEHVHLSPSPCLRRVRQIEESGVIRGYTVIVDEEAVGLPVTAFIRVRLQVHEKAQFTAFERAVSKVDAVVDCYLIVGGTDYLLRVIVGSLKDYETLMRKKIHDPGHLHRRHKLRAQPDKAVHHTSLER